ncbi:MAG: hypothetical protein FJ308_10405 [Planctomycetes bacterium]|nr:hypothetical protein [Planctomycetota bacterium]
MMQIPAVAQQMIDIDRQSQQAALEKATLLMSKQMDVAKDQGNAMVQLIQQVANITPGGGIDIRA